MIPFDEIKKYLPQYLSISAQKGLFEELSQFPHNIDQRIYTSFLAGKENIFQGDGIEKLLYVNLPNTEVGEIPGMILSNTCDIDQDNQRIMPLRMVYTPIFNLAKYRQLLIENYVNTEKRNIASINTHIDNIQRQYISHIFYLPKGGTLENDSIIFFDRLTNCTSGSIERQTIPSRRIFSLSDYGFYLFLFKLSIHFTRIRESVSRITH